MGPGSSTPNCRHPHRPFGPDPRPAAAPSEVPKRIDHPSAKPRKVRRVAEARGSHAEGAVRGDGRWGRQMKGPRTGKGILGAELTSSY